MIVVDSNVIAYCWLNTPLTKAAQAVRLRDPDWQVPLLWRSELRSILAGYVRAQDLTVNQAIHVMAEVERELDGAEHLVSSAAVLTVAKEANLSAYDAEFVALARMLSVPLVTEDRAVLKACRDIGRSMADFLRPLP